MVWGFLIVGIVLFGIGIVGQVRVRSKTRFLPEGDRRARAWVFTVGAIVAGALLMAVWVAHLISYGEMGRW